MNKDERWNQTDECKMTMKTSYARAPNPNPLVPVVQKEENCDARSRLDYIVCAHHSNLTPTTQNTLASASNTDHTARAAWKVPIAA